MAALAFDLPESKPRPEPRRPMKRKTHIQAVGQAVAVCAALMVPAPTGAQNYPVKPVRIVAPASPGGGIDVVARIAAEHLTAAFNQQFIVENRPGAGGRTGTESVARAAPDGYTLLAGTAGTLILAPAMYPKLAYSPLRDFSPVSLAATTSYLMVSHPSVPASSVRELVALAKGRPGRLNYASTGVGSPAHLGGELFNTLAGIRTVHVPYKGSVGSTTAVMQGETDFMFSNFLSSLALVKSGRLRALGVTSLKRSALVPELPTVDESGLRGFEMQQFYSLLAPAGTNRDIIARLNQEIVSRLPSADTKRRLAAEGTEVMVTTPDDLARILSSQTAKWGKIIRQAGIKADD